MLTIRTPLPIGGEGHEQSKQQGVKKQGQITSRLNVKASHRKRERTLGAVGRRRGGVFCGAARL